MSRPAPGQLSCIRMSASAVAAAAPDHGRRVHELPWLYLDSVGQEYGPVPGRTMREWLTLGRFPVGRDLRVRLPEWEQHLPLHQLYPDLSSAFLLPPAWPSTYVDDMLQGEESDTRASLVAAGILNSDGEARGYFDRVETAGIPGLTGTCLITESGLGQCTGVCVGASSTPEGGHWVPLPRLWLAGITAQQRPAVREHGQDLELLQAGMMQFTHESLRQEEQLLPPPPPQPSYQQLQELVSQLQEGPPLWKGPKSFQCMRQAQTANTEPDSTGACSIGAALHRDRV